MSRILSLGVMFIAAVVVPVTVLAAASSTADDSADKFVPMSDVHLDEMQILIDQMRQIPNTDVRYKLMQDYLGKMFNRIYPDKPTQPVARPGRNAPLSARPQVSQRPIPRPLPPAYRPVGPTVGYAPGPVWRGPVRPMPPRVPQRSWNTPPGWSGMTMPPGQMPYR